MQPEEAGVTNHTPATGGNAKYPHTPWPWKVKAAEFKDNGVVAYELIMSRPEISARVADLINAAPDLLEACKAFVQAESEWAVVRASMPPDSFDDPLGSAYKLALSAIAKAEGNRAA